MYSNNQIQKGAKKEYGSIITIITVTAHAHAIEHDSAEGPGFGGDGFVQERGSFMATAVHVKGLHPIPFIWIA